MVEKRKIWSAPYDLPVSKDDSPYTPEQLTEMTARVKYEGDPRQKKNRGNFSLQSDVRPSPQKTLCDKVGIFDQGEALSLLKGGMKNGLVSPPDSPQRYDLPWPKRVWAIHEKTVVEARHTGNGVYHGFPQLENQPLREIIFDRVNNK